MGKSIFYRLFGAGKQPRSIGEALAREELLYSTEGIGVTKRKRGSIKGTGSFGGSISAHFGGFAVTKRRVLGWVAGGKVVDALWDVEEGKSIVRLAFTETGMNVVWDLPRANPAWEGEMSLTFKQPLSQQDLAQLPKKELSFDISADNVRRFFRRTQTLE